MVCKMNLKIDPNVKTKVVNVAKKLGGKPLLYASKGVGVVATAAVLYDAHINGVEKAIVKDDIDTANRFYNQHRQFRMSNTNSATVSKMKNVWYEMQQSFPFNHSTSKVFGYLGGFCMTVAKNLPVLALSAVSVLAKNPTVSKVAGSLIAAYGAKVVCDDVIANDFSEKLVK